MSGDSRSRDPAGPTRPRTRIPAWRATRTSPTPPFLPTDPGAHREPHVATSTIE
jgi:hypothetical protein